MSENQNFHLCLDRLRSVRRAKEEVQEDCIVSRRRTHDSHVCCALMQIDFRLVVLFVVLTPEDFAVSYNDNQRFFWRNRTVQPDWLFFILAFVSYL